jgi:predicted amidophosphoribosyltransferase
MAGETHRLRQRQIEFAAGSAGAPNAMSGNEINIVSGGYAICLACGARLSSVGRACPICNRPLKPGTFRLVRSADAAREDSALPQTREPRQGSA